jgi:glycerol-1-phosphate dehydrogenase [NAD(P)+]
MQLASSSRPASGSEHRFSHLWEMQALSRSQPAVSHGFKVGVGSIAVAALYECLLARDPTDIDVDALCRAWPTPAEVERAVRAGHADPRIAHHAVAESLEKHVGVDVLRARLARLQARWPTIRARLEAQLLPAAELRRLLQAAGCPTRPDQIGLDLEGFRASHALARTIRARYTVLDLLADTGLLDDCVEELFAPNGFWGMGPAGRLSPVGS